MWVVKAVSVFLLSLSTAQVACAQQPDVPPVAEVLGALPRTGEFRLAQVVETHHRFECGGQDYNVRFSEREADGDRMREVRLLAVETPSGALATREIEAIQNELAPFWLLFSAQLRCEGEGFSLTFYGRRREDSDNHTILVSIDGLKVVRITR